MIAVGGRPSTAAEASVAKGGSRAIIPVQYNSHLSTAYTFIQPQSALDTPVCGAPHTQTKRWAYHSPVNGLLRSAPFGYNRSVAKSSVANKSVVMPAAELERRLADFYRHHNPDRVVKVPAIMAEFARRGGGAEELKNLNDELLEVLPASH